MPTLASFPLTLNGTCDCASITYAITIPPLLSRPIAFTDKETGAEIRYPTSFLDHCNRCRRVSGVLVQAWLTVPQEWVIWTVKQTSISNPENETKGEGREEPGKGAEGDNCTTAELISLNSNSSIPVTNYISSPGVRRTFCGRCGTNLAFVNLERDMGVGEGEGKVPTVDIVLGSLERESLEVKGVWPARHEYWDSGVEWIKRLVTEGDRVLAGVEGEMVPRHPEGNWDAVV